jgi:hypothetical protein
MSDLPTGLRIGEQAETEVDLTKNGQICIRQPDAGTEAQLVFLNRETALVVAKWLMRVADVPDAQWNADVAKMRANRIQP